MRLKILKSFSFYAVMAGLAACSGFSLTGGPGPTVLPRLVPKVSDASGLLQVNTVLLMPLSLSEGTRALSPSSKQLFSDLQAAAAEELGANLLASQEALNDFDWTQSEVSAQELKRLAKRAGADAVLITNLHNLVEREGSKIGASQGAQVSFEMRLLAASDLKEIWGTSYFFQDRALSENLFRAPERLKNAESLGWQNSTQILKQGFRAAFRDLSQKRQSQFIG